MNKKLFLLIVVLLASLLTACGGSTPQGGGPATPTAARITPTPALPSAGTIRATISGLGAVRESIPLDDGIAASDSAVWVHNGDAGKVFRIDPGTNTIVATIPVGHGEGGVAIGQGAVWVASPTEGRVSRIDPQTNKVVATIPFAPQQNVVALTVSPGAVWVTDFYNYSLIRIDPRTNKVVATIPNQAGITGVSFGAGSVWACNHHDPAQGLVRLDPQTNKVQAQIAVGQVASGLDSNTALSCSSVVALAHTVWTVSHVNGDVTSIVLKRIDPATNTVSATIPVPGALPFHFAADERGVWLYSDTMGLLRVDPHTNRVVGELAMTGGSGVAVGAGSVWFANATMGTLLRITPAS